MPGVHKAAQTVKLTEIVNQIMGDAIDSVIMPAALQGRGSVATDLVIVSNCLSSERVKIRKKGSSNELQLFLFVY